MLKYGRRDEPAYEEDEEIQEDFYDPEVPQTEGALDDDEDKPPEAEPEVIVSGDPSAAANAGRGSDRSHKDKKIPSELRMTTPYMTKYEKARILGTRALQIRYVPWVCMCGWCGWRGWRGGCLANVLVLTA